MVKMRTKGKTDQKGFKYTIVIIGTFRSVVKIALIESIEKRTMFRKRSIWILGAKKTLTAYLTATVGINWNNHIHADTDSRE